MATRTDISVFQQLSPRVAEVSQPSSEVVMQDYVDTLRIEEEQFDAMGYERLIDASGKQDLGGGVLVGITVQQNNIQLAFEPNTTPVHIGTVTTPSGAPNAVGRITFADSTADWVAADVVPGSFIINFTKNSIVDVVRVVDTTMLETRTPANGTDDEFDIGDVIHVFNIRQCTTSGGNLVAADENGSTIPAILPTAFTQVILQTSSSATIQELADIQFASYNNGVTIDIDNNTGRNASGTTFPTGTGRQPCDNWTDALAIADSLGLFTFYVVGGAAIPLLLDFTDKEFVGQSRTRTTLIVQDGSLLDRCVFTEATVSGAFTAGNLVELNECEIEDLSNIAGAVYDCGMEGVNSLTTNLKTEFVRAYSEVAGGSATNILDINNAELFIRDYQGGIELRNKGGTAPVSIDISSGQVVVNDNCSAGTITLRGLAKWTNESTYAGGTTILNEMMSNQSIAAAVWNSLVSTYVAANSFGQLVGRRLLTAAKFFTLK